MLWSDTMHALAPTMLSEFNTSLTSLPIFPARASRYTICKKFIRNDLQGYIYNKSANLNPWLLWPNFQIMFSAKSTFAMTWICRDIHIKFLFHSISRSIFCEYISRPTFLLGCFDKIFNFLTISKSANLSPGLLWLNFSKLFSIKYFRSDRCKFERNERVWRYRNQRRACRLHIRGQEKSPGNFKAATYAIITVLFKSIVSFL